MNMNYKYEIRKVGERGQITIPIHLRDKYGVTPGDLLMFTEEEGGIKLKKVKRSQSPIAELRGIINPKRKVEDVIKEASYGDKRG